MAPIARYAFAAALLLLTASGLGMQLPPPSWTVTEEPELSGSAPVTVLTTTSTGSIPSTEGTRTSATLQVRCSGTRTSVTISSDAAFAVKSEAPTTLSVRLDADPAVQAGWANLTLHRILIYNLRSLLLSHQRLAIGLPLGGHGPQTLTFDLSQLPATMREHNCRRRLE